jgi:hypothetical protein
LLIPIPLNETASTDPNAVLREPEMEAVAEWSVTEYLDADWPTQRVWRELDEPVGVGPFVVDDGNGKQIPAQIGDQGKRVYYIAELAAGETLNYRLCEVEEERPTPLQLTVENGVARIRNEVVGLRLAWEGSEPNDPPILGLQGRDRIWFGGTSWGEGVEFVSLDCELLDSGPVFIRLRQTYRTAGGAEVVWEYLIDAATPTVRISLCQKGKIPGAAIWNLGKEFQPTRVYWRPHSPAGWRGEQGNHKRQVYEPRYRGEGDGIRLGPFYNWEKDAANFWTGWGEDERRDLLYLGCIRPGKTRVAGAYERMHLRTGMCAGETYLDAEIPFQEGERAFALGLLDRHQVDIPISGEAGGLDRLHARLNGPGLDDYHQMVLDWGGLGELCFPGLWLSPDEVPEVRQRFGEWDWLRERFQAHVDDELFPTHHSPDFQLQPGQRVLGRDMAGAYLATGDERFAGRAKEPLVRELDEIVSLLLEYGPSTDGAVGISLARRWRSLVLNLDLVLGSKAFSAGERQSILRRLAFVAEVSCTDDAWPATGSGIHRGNPNFHPDVVSARVLGAVMLKGHPRQEEWIEAGVEEMRRFLRDYHLFSGCSGEAATYQLCVLAYALLLQVALRSRGYGGLVEDPIVKKSFEYLAAIQTPVDPRCGFRMLPTIGHVTAYGWSQSLQAYFAWGARLTAESDPDFSRRMMAAWRRGGSFVFSLHDFSQDLIWSQPLCLLDGELPAEEDSHFLESRAHEGLGAVMRTKHDDGSEGYLLFKMGESTGHYDNDEGSLIWYAFGQPLLTDFGCQYNPNFHAHPWLHNRISIDHAADGPPRGGRLVKRCFAEGLDFSCGEVRISRLYSETEWPVRERDFDFRQVMGEMREVEEQAWRRHVIYVHAMETVILLDQIDGNLPTDWNLQVLADSVRTIDGSALFRGQFGVDLQVTMFQPNDSKLEVAAFSHLGFDEPRLPMNWWRGVAWTAPPGVELGPMEERALTLRGHAGPGESYMVVLTAFRAGEEEPQIVQRGDWGVEVCSRRGEIVAEIGQAFDHWEIEVSRDGKRTEHVVDLPVE